ALLLEQETSAIISSDCDLLVLCGDHQARQSVVRQSDHAQCVGAGRWKGRIRKIQVITPVFDESAIPIAKVNVYCGPSASAALSSDVNISVAIKIGRHYLVDVAPSYGKSCRTAIGKCAVSAIE